MLFLAVCIDVLRVLQSHVLDQHPPSGVANNTGSAGVAEELRFSFLVLHMSVLTPEHVVRNVANSIISAVTANVGALLGMVNWSISALSHLGSLQP